MGERFALFEGDCLDYLPMLDGIDAVVSDPPYGLKFMGKGWDHGIPGAEYWTAIMAACKPGAHLLAFGGTRTFHRLTCAIEDAGWEIRDVLMWVYGQGFPKSLNLNGEYDGMGTALKPAWEPIILARKPLEGTVAENVKKYGTGALNIDACRIQSGPSDGGNISGVSALGQSSGWNPHANRSTEIDRTMAQGRWPANLLHDGSQEVLDLFPSKAGASAPVRGDEPSANHKSCYSQRERVPGTFHNDTGSAARFFYCSKASKADREEGFEELEAKPGGEEYRPNDGGDKGIQSRLHGATVKGRNHHPTVKPTALMRYLCRLITPPGGLILDPFMGSGSTGKAAMLEGFQFIGIDMEPDYVKIARARIEHSVKDQPLVTPPLP